MVAWLTNKGRLPAGDHQQGQHEHRGRGNDTLPAGDGLLEAGYRVPLGRLEAAMEDWFRRKGYLTAEDRLEVTELGGP